MHGQQNVKIYLTCLQILKFKEPNDRMDRRELLWASKDIPRLQLWLSKKKNVINNGRKFRSIICFAES